jgi:hypothetical protein
MADSGSLTLRTPIPRLRALCFTGASPGANYPPGPLTAAGSSCLSAATVSGGCRILLSPVPSFLVTTDYKSSVFLPKTDFPMRGGLPKKEPELLKRWADMRLWDRLRVGEQGPAEVRAARRPSLRQRQPSYRARAEQDPEGRDQPHPADAGQGQPLRAGLGLPRPADRMEDRGAVPRQEAGQGPGPGRRIPRANAAPSPITGSQCSARSSSASASTATGTTTTRR